MSEIGAKSRIDDFLAQKRFAMVGVSRNTGDFSRVLLREFLKRGYDVVPVNPEGAAMEGRECATSLRAVAPPVDSVLMMTSPAVTEALMPDCEASGVRRVWMYRAAGAGAVSPKALEFCQTKGIAVVPGECPLMFLRDAAWYHKVHGLVRHIIGSYPK